MLAVRLTSRSGVEQTLAAQADETLMDAIRGAGNDELLALCGGCCACATCHVIVDPAWFDRTGRPGADENDLLDGSSSRCATSRLSCQIRMSDALDGLCVTIAPED